jgi:TfoX/Sxy family transcriptional regulator of competence genes
MASDLDFMEYITENVKNSGNIRFRKMFGEYCLYCDEKVVALICDNKLFVKPTNAGREFIGNVTEGFAYPGAKPSFLIEDRVEDSDWLTELIKITANALPLPLPLPKSNKKRKK